MSGSGMVHALLGTYSVKHTIVTINGFMGAPDALMPADTARALGGDRPDGEVIWVPLDYNSGAFPLGEGVKDGVTKGRALIRSIPGTFMLAMFSEGTVIGAELENDLLHGELSDRNGDWIASVKWGDARRELHRWYGAATDPGGAGIAGPDNVVNTDPRIRSYVYEQNFGDVYTNCKQDAAGKRMTLAYQFIIERWSGLWDSLVDEFEEFVGAPVPNALSILVAILRYFMFIGPQAQAPHMNYPINDAVAYLRQRIAEVPARTAA